MIFILPLAVSIGNMSSMSIVSYAWYLLRLLMHPAIRGPVWYLSLTLVFDTIYASFNTTHLQKLSSISSRIRTIPPILILVGDIASSFIIRLYWPLNHEFTPLNLKVGYLPQYITAYITGIYLHSNPSVMHIPHLRTFSMQALAIFTATSIPLLVGPWRMKDGDFTPFVGGWTMQALLYSIWNEIGFCLGTHLAWETVRQVASSRFQPSRWAYGAFLLHPVVCTLFQISFRSWIAPPVFKTAIVGLLSVIFSFLAGRLALLLPYAPSLL